MTGFQIANQVAGAMIMFIGVLTGFALTKAAATTDKKHEDDES